MCVTLSVPAEKSMEFASEETVLSRAVSLGSWDFSQGKIKEKPKIPGHRVASPLDGSRV